MDGMMDGWNDGRTDRWLDMIGYMNDMIFSGSSSCGSSSYGTWNNNDNNHKRKESRNHH